MKCAEYALELLRRDERLSFNDYLYLFKECDTHELASVAERLTESTCGNYVSFVNNIVVNYTNICVARCPLCAFYRDLNDEDAYVLSPDDVVKIVEKAYVEHGITEVHYNGGLNPDLDVEYFERTFKLIKSRIPHVTIKGLTAAEIWYYSRRWKMSYKEVIDRLKRSGMDVISGGGAEIFNEEVRKVIAPNKLSGDEWIRVAEIAHRMCVLSNATMLYGHVERPEHVVEHLMMIRELQERTGGIMMFIPLRFSPHGTDLYRRGLVRTRRSSEYDVRVTAISRIVLRDLVKMVAAYWVSVGKRLASVLLRSGANDLVGTMVNERVFRSTGREEVTTVEELVHIAREAGRQPVQRDTYGNVIRVF